MADAASISLLKNGPNRIVISLSWDPISREEFVKQPRIYRSGAAGLWDRFLTVLDYISFMQISRSYYKYNYDRIVKFKDETARDVGFRHYDLDLYCYIYDIRNELITAIGPESRSAIDKSGKIYHSGDNFSGHGYDEQIHIETGGLPNQYMHFVLAVKSDCRYNLNQISNIQLKIADSKTGQAYFNATLNKSGEGDPFGYVVASLHRIKNDLTVTPIHEFVDDNADWGRILRKYTGEPLSP